MQKSDTKSEQKKSYKTFKNNSRPVLITHCPYHHLNRNHISKYNKTDLQSDINFKRYRYVLSLKFKDIILKTE